LGDANADHFDDGVLAVHEVDVLQMMTANDAGGAS
jgi:hypothetical protein